MHIHNNRSVYFLSFTYIFYLLIGITKIKRLVNNRLCTYIMLKFPNTKSLSTKLSIQGKLTLYRYLKSTEFWVPCIPYVIDFNLKSQISKWLNEKTEKTEIKYIVPHIGFYQDTRLFIASMYLEIKRVTSWSLKVNLHLIANRKYI